VDEDVPGEVLEAFGLGAATCAVMPEGAMNRHWRVIAGDRTVVLRRYGAMRSAETVRWEQRLVAHAAGKAWPTPVALPASGGQTLIEHGGRLWSLHSLLEGSPPSATSVGSRRIMGRLLGRLHRDLEGFEERAQRPGLGKVWELDVMVEPAGAGSFNSLLAMFGKEHPEIAGRVRRERYRNLRELSRLHYPDLPDRPIHGDFEPWNLLFKDGQLTGVLDFDQARRDALACDIAPLLMPFTPLAPNLARALLEGYQSVRPLSELEWELLPALVRAALLWWVAHLLVRWRLGAGEEAVARIDRTINVRMSAFDAAEGELRALRV
jgi:Ser/Thr protein kinase RdoA (MazF antagonist)